MAIPHAHQFLMFAAGDLKRVDCPKGRGPRNLPSGRSRLFRSSRRKDADNGSESQEWRINAELVGSSAILCETRPIAANAVNGEDGIRTRGRG